MKPKWIALLTVALTGCPGVNPDDAGSGGDGVGLPTSPGIMEGSSGAIDDPTTSGQGGGAMGDDSASTGIASTGNGDDDDVNTLWDVPLPPDAGLPESSCPSGPDEDFDNDGFTVVEGDCNDCDANVNPGAIEVAITEPDDMGMIPEPADEDCDGLVDNVAPPCDAGLTLTDADPFSAAAAMGLCKVSSGVNDWGIVDAQYVRANGVPVTSAVQHGLHPNFGPNITPLEGDRLLALSSGHSRIPGQADACNSQTCLTSGASAAPAGFPQDVPACPGLSNIFDDIALEVTLRAPTNATGYAFSFDFYSFEYPEWVCTSYNDQFIALVDPPPMGAINGNISFDSLTNPVSVNIAFFEVCAEAGCTLGTAELAGTGFDAWNDAGATSWLVTTAPVDGGTELTIRFAIWDTGDQAYDSTTLLDNFRWIADGGTVVVGTTPEG